MKGNTDTKNRWIPQNLGWLDRLLRFVIGTAILAISLTILVLTGQPEWLSPNQEVADWVYYAPFISLYFFFTAMLGADPVYGLLRLRSCGNSPRNPCGTFPFEVDAALGHNPMPESDIEHSLSTSRHQKPGKT